jgi:hypothetical protein
MIPSKVKVDAGMLKLSIACLVMASASAGVAAAPARRSRSA